MMGKVYDQRPGFYMVYNDVLDDLGSEMGPMGVAVYNALCRFANQQGDCHPSLKTIGEKVGIKSRTTVRAQLTKLVALGLITVEGRLDDQGDPDTNSYHINHYQRGGGRSADDLGVGQQMGEGRSLNGGGVGQEMTINNTYMNNMDQNKSKSAPAPTLSEPDSRVVRKQQVYKSPHFDKRKFDVASGYVKSGQGETPIEIYYERFELASNDARLTVPQEDDLVSICTDLNRYREIIIAYSRTGFRPGNVNLILDWYRNGIPEKYQAMTMPVSYKPSGGDYPSRNVNRGLAAATAYMLEKGMIDG